MSDCSDSFLSGPDSSEANFSGPSFFGELGAALMMMPILGLAVAGLRGKDLAQATGLSNMLRQLGGAVGVALINIYQTVSADIRGNMVANISDYSDATIERLNAFSQIFWQAGYSSDQAMQAARQMLDSALAKQQMLVAYNHGFLMLGLSILLCIPVILMIRYKKGEKIKAVSDH